MNMLRKVVSKLMPLAVRRWLALLLYPEDALSGALKKELWLRVKDRIDADPDMGVMVFDVNNFKAVNDQAGHDQGDLLIQETASTLRAVMRRHGLSDLYRWGGDEFVIPTPVGLRHLEICEEARREFGVRAYDGLQVRLAYGIGPTFKDADTDLYATKGLLKDFPASRNR